MGTNYYLRTGKSTPEGCAEELHIGKSSCGWCFALHVIPEAGINDLPDWEKLFKQRGTSIVDEYGKKVAVKTMLSIITDRSFGRDLAEVPTFYRSWHHFHKLNHSEAGPFGLVRAKVGQNCVGHGAGTWDLITGEFC